MNTGGRNESSRSPLKFLWWAHIWDSREVKLVKRLQYFYDWDTKQQQEHLKGKYSLIFLNGKYLGFIIHTFSTYCWTIYVFLYIHIYISSKKKISLYLCLNAAAVTIYEQWNSQAPSSAGLHCPYCTKATEQCYRHSPGFEPAPPKSSSKTKLLFQWKGSHGLQ